MKLQILIALLSLFAQPCFALKSSQYQALLVPLDLYGNKSGTKELLSRRALVSRIIKKGLPVQIANQDFKTSKENYQLVYDSFEIPRTTLSGSYVYSETTGTIPYRAKTYGLGIGLSGDLGWGLQYTANLPRVTSTFYDYTTSTIPSSTASMGIGVTLPLLRGSWFFLQRIQKDQADVDFDLARETLRQTALQTILTGEQAYFSYLVRLTRVRVLERALESAKALQTDVAELVKVGEYEKNSLVKVELQAAQTENDLLTAQADLQAAKQVIRDILALSYDESVDLVPDPAELMHAVETTGYEFSSAVEIAKKNRPDYLSALYGRRRAELAEQQAFSNMLPTLNFVTTYGYEKTATEPGQALSELTKFGQPAYSVGLEFSYSLFNDSDKANHRKSTISRIRSELALTSVQNQINNEISASIQNLHLGQRRLKTSELARKLAESRLAAEFEKFKVGESNIRNVIDFQNELNSARIGEVNARAELHTQFAAFRTALGELPAGFTFEVAGD